MLGEKRNLSLFASQPAQEEKQVKHITVDRDGEKKDIPLYFGPDWPVVNGTGDTVPSPSDDPSACQAEATAEKTEETVPVEPIPQDTAAGIADNSPDSDVQYPDDSPRRILASNTVVANRTHALFFAPEGDSRDFNSVLKEVQEYISGKYSSLITDGGDEDAKSQIKRYITKYVQDQRIAVKGYSADGLVDALYTEMAEFGLLTKYIFGTGIEEININSWRDIEVLYSNGQMVKLDEHFDSPGHAINVIRRMLHVSGMVLDNASPAVLGHLSKNIRIAVLKTPLVDEDVGVTASIRIVNPQNMQKDDFVRGGTATGDMLDFLSACLRYGVSVCVAGATGSGKTTVAGWLLTTIPDNKRVFTIENGSRELDLVREKDGKVCNSVIHTITRESENAKQNIDQDMLLDMALREKQIHFCREHCVVHPLKKRTCCRPNESLELCCDVAMLLTCHKLEDDLHDEGFLKRTMVRLILPFARRDYRKAAAFRPELAQKLREQMQRQQQLEDGHCANVDQAAEPTACLMGQVLSSLSEDPMRRRVLERLGYLLGRFVYLIDALDDWDEDTAKGRYNPFAERAAQKQEHCI